MLSHIIQQLHDCKLPVKLQEDVIFDFQNPIITSA